MRFQTHDSSNNGSHCQGSTPFMSASVHIICMDSQLFDCVHSSRFRELTKTTERLLCIAARSSFAIVCGTNPSENILALCSVLSFQRAQTHAHTPAFLYSKREVSSARGDVPLDFFQQHRRRPKLHADATIRIYSHQ